MTEAQIKEALIALLDGIKKADASVISIQMAALDDVAERQRGVLPPQLLHFLERRSYAKALQYLGGGDPLVPGTCAPRHRTS